MSHALLRPLGPIVVVLLALTGAWTAGAEEVAPAVRAVQDPVTGQVDIWEADRPVLRYNYQPVPPPEGFLAAVTADNRKYAAPRSDYIHPLYGLDGETLTADWSKDHPHHRGIYWAWPEVDYRGNRGDLHALQQVFSRPTGNLALKSTADYAEIEAENLWKWEDTTPIVRERATIRVWRRSEAGRWIDLEFRFEAIQDDVALARRGEKHYGGLNVRLASAENLALTTHTDPAGATPRRAWGEATGIWPGGNRLMSLVFFQHSTNPHYPGDWIEYPGLPWLQPTFPAADTRYVLKKGVPLQLAYRLWIHSGGPLPEEAYVQQRQAFEPTRLHN